MLFSSPVRILNLNRVRSRAVARKSLRIALAWGLCSLTLAGPVIAQQKPATKQTTSKPTQQPQAPAKASPLEKIPKVVAVVNGQTITRDKLAQDCIERFGSIVLDNLMNKHLILQACKAKGITITQADVNNELTRMSNKFGLSTKLFLEAMEKNRGIAPEQLATEVVWPMLALRTLAADKIQVSPQEIDAVMQSEYGPKVQVRMIAVSQADKARQLHAEATAKPDNFRRLAKEQSEDAVSASVEGLLPPIRRNSGDDQLEKIAFQLQPNQISPIFQIGEMHVFLQCVRQVQATPPAPQAIKSIQENIADQLRDKRLGEAANEIFANLQKTSQVVTVYGNKELETKNPGVAGYLNQEPIPMDLLAAECIQRHGRDILKGEINRKLLENALKAAGRQVVQADVDREISRAADALGFLRNDGTPDTDAWLKSIMQEEGTTIDLYVQDAVWPSCALKKLVEDSVQVTQEDLKKGFEANFGPRAEVLAIVLRDQRTAQDVWQQARKNLTEAAFGELAAKYSTESVSRSNYGKVPPIRRHGGQPTLEQAAFDTTPGEISSLVAMDDQYVILYKQGETKPLVRDLEAVRPEIQKEILEKKLRVAMQNRLDELLKSAQIDNFIEQSSQTPLPPPTAPTGPTAARPIPTPTTTR
jgi:parvulin-like peptidyl-prolyl isomerase